MRHHTFTTVVVPALLAVYLPFCTPAVQPTVPPWSAPLAHFWVQPSNLPERDLFAGEWSPSHAPNPRDTYTFLEPKHGGVNPGMTVRDSEGRKWSIKQAATNGQG